MCETKYSLHWDFTVVINAPLRIFANVPSTVHCHLRLLLDFLSKQHFPALEKGGLKFTEFREGWVKNNHKKSKKSKFILHLIFSLQLKMSSKLWIMIQINVQNVVAKYLMQKKCSWKMEITTNSASHAPCAAENWIILMFAVIWMIFSAIIAIWKIMVQLESNTNYQLKLEKSSLKTWVLY